MKDFTLPMRRTVPHGKGHVQLGDIILRTCNSQDLNQVLAIEKDCFPDPYPRREFLYYLVRARKGFIVALKDRALVGYVIAKALWGRGHIVSVAVSPNYQRRGIGERLMGAAIGHLAGKNVKKVYLEVRASDKGQIEFYHRLSFNETGGIKKRYYPDGEDAVVMVKGIRAQD